MTGVQTCALPIFPAVIAYNLIIGSIREMASRNDDFALEMLNLMERQQVPSAAEVRR